MLDSALTHPKMRRLSRELRIPLPWAVGTMQMLWVFAKEHYPAGDIGRADDIDIEEAVGWPVERSGELIPALIAARWLDTDEQSRLLVHDWADHCTDFVHLKLFRAGRIFADGTVPKCKMAGLKSDERAAYLDFLQKYTGQTENVHGPSMDKTANSVVRSEAKRSEATRSEAMSGEDAREAEPDPEPNSDFDPTPPPPPRGKAPVPIHKPRQPGGLQRIRAEDMPKPGGGLDPKQLAKVLGDFAPRLPDPSTDADLCRRVATAMANSNWRLDDLIELLKRRRDTVRKAQSWGLIITIIEAACRGRPLGVSAAQNALAASFRGQHA